ncbi:MAG: sulfurtransferase [unclassified Hahellaceae]|mgnify:CR=1 FL=1|nr:sulfurtransferase [Hahellaceae bacterium]|tara:strand:+ start:76246 stop:77607 length:1362 start_codon:yes stop_codon:yes gene_type:complete
MKLITIQTPAIAHFAYLLCDGNEAALIDPRRDVDEYLTAAREQGCTIRYVVVTHRQEDFVLGSAHLSELTGASIVTGKHELFGHGDIRLADHESFELGSLKIVALETPGHTPESMCYAVYEADSEVPWCVFTGDTLFFGDTGRTDLPDVDDTAKNAGVIYDSVHQQLAGLGDTTIVLPAHGPGSVCGSGMAEKPLSTIGAEKRYNKVFTLTRSEFVEYKGREKPPRPPYFRHMEKVNLSGGLPPKSNEPDLLTSSEVSKLQADHLLIDTREPEAFAGGHVPDSYSVWMGGLPVFGGWVANPESPVVLICDRTDDVAVATRHLSRIGIDKVTAGLTGGFSEWRKEATPIRSCHVITPKALHEQRDKYVVLDVREDDEFASGHIENAQNIYVGHLADRLDQLKAGKSDRIAVTCGVGHRAGVAVSILLKAGYTNVSNLLGGMSAWQKFELPVIKA